MKFKFSCDEWGIPRKNEGYRATLSVADRVVYDCNYNRVIAPMVAAHQAEWEKPNISKVTWNQCVPCNEDPVEVHHAREWEIALVSNGGEEKWE